MKKTPKILLIVFLFVFAIGATFLITFREAGKLYAAAGGAASVEGQKADEVSSYLKKYFIDDYDDEKLADAAASAMRVCGLCKSPQTTSLHQIYIKWCRYLCRGEKIA